jgi:hypothetical protein
MESPPFFRAVMHLHVCFADEGQRPKDKPAQGSALGVRRKMRRALKGRRKLLPPFQGWVFGLGETQGVTLGWLVYAPLVLLALTGQSS